MIRKQYISLGAVFVRIALIVCSFHCVNRSGEHQHERQADRTWYRGAWHHFRYLYGAVLRGGRGRSGV